MSWWWLTLALMSAASAAGGTPAEEPAAMHVRPAAPAPAADRPGVAPAQPRADRGLPPGAPISLSLREADLRDVLRSFAQLGGFDLVLDASVRGSVTVELRQVPWERALQVILQTHGLGAEIDGRILRLRPAGAN